MIRVVFWKEVREQSAILIALAAMGAGIIVAGAVLGSVSAGKSPFDLTGYTEPARLAAVVLTAVSGLVIGSTMFAGEYENGTAEYFLQLPAGRHRVWLAKASTGMVLTFAMSIAFFLVAWASGVFASTIVAGWAIWFSILGLSSLTAGLFGSACARQVLPACGIGIGIGPTVSSATSMTAVMVLRYLESDFPQYGMNGHNAIPMLLAIGPLSAMLVMLLMSYVVFTNPDRERRRFVLTPKSLKTAVKTIRNARTPSSRFGIRTLFWFIRRTWLPYLFVLHAISLIAGLILLIPDLPAAYVWPGMAVVLGVLAGVFCFVEEQLNGSNRFWAERALPPGRLWFAKVSAGLACLLSCLVLALIPLIIVTLVRGRRGGGDGDELGWLTLFASHMFRTGLIDVGFPVVKGILLWPIYGFAAGLLAGMCFQKPIVSCAVGFMVGAATSALWIPSLISGGLHGWQVWPVPFIAILMSRFLIREWTLDRIAKGRGLAKLSLAIALPLAWMAFGIGFRAFEVPACPEMDDDILFSKQLPTADDQQPGRQLKRVLAQFATVREQTRGEPAEKFFGPASMRQSWLANRFQNGTRVEHQLTFVARMGYPTDRADFDRWLDAIFSKLDWQNDLAKIIGKPPGVFLDPNELTPLSRLPEVVQFHQMAEAVLVRGLQQQSRGIPDDAINRIEAILAATRTVKHHTTMMGLVTGRNTENTIPMAVERWLERLDRDPANLRRMLAVLREHAEAPADSFNDYQLAQQVISRMPFAIRKAGMRISALDRSGLRDGENSGKDRLDAEAELVQFAWTVPWERERLHRIIGLKNAATTPPGPLNRLGGWWRTVTFRNGTVTATPPRDYLRGCPGSHNLFEPMWFDAFRMAEWETNRLAAFRGAILQCAIRLFEAEKGRLPKDLDELVPEYLPSVPVDPYSMPNKPFRYEISKGRPVYLEEMEQPGPTPGTEPEIGWRRDEFLAFAAVAGCTLAFPVSEMPTSPPGFDPAKPPFMEDEQNAAVALMGGTILWPLGMGEIPDGPEGGGAAGGPGGAGGPAFYVPPAIPVAIAGMGGAGAASIHELNIIPEGFGEEQNPSLRFTQSKIAREIPKGQAILWSVGPDRIDDGGIWQANVGSNRGDLIYLVPPAVKWKPSTRGEPK